MPVPENMRYRFRGSIAPGSTPRAALLDGAVEAGVAKLRLYDPIDSWGGEWGVSAKEFTSTLDALDGDVTEIHLHINSPGGEVYEGHRDPQRTAQPPGPHGRRGRRSGCIGGLVHRHWC